MLPVREEDKNRDKAKSGDVWWVISATLAVAALAVAIIVFVVANGKSSGASTPATAKGATEFSVVLADITLTPGRVDVQAGVKITVHVENKGAIAHDFKVNGTTGTEMLQPGQKATIEIGPFDSDVTAWCSVPGHKDAGMSMTIHVVGGTSQTGSGSTATTAPADNSAKIDAAAVPAHDWVARDPKLAAPLAGTVHEIAFDATEKLIEVAPGVKQLMWTFNDQVPGPTLHGKVGDTFRITLTNKGTMGHSIDFHASKVAWSDEMRTIKPGESLVYEFKAEFAGAFMYHCGTAPALHHIGNGMYGMVIIDPPDLKPVDQEFAVVQSELYLGPDSQPGDLKKMINEQWDAVMFNGYVNQYKFRPIHVEANKRYRMWVLDAGPNENSAFHIVGTIFDTVFKEGVLDLQPDGTHGGSQVLDLQPAQGGYVEFTFAEDGLYPFVTHKFANVGKGALGFFAVGKADTTALGGH